MINDLLKLGSAAFEVTGAAREAASVVENGGSIEEALRAFANSTENELDDEAVERLLEALTAIGEYAKVFSLRLLTASLVVGNIADEVAERSPEVRENLQNLSKTVAGVVAALDSVRVRKD